MKRLLALLVIPLLAVSCANKSDKIIPVPLDKPAKVAPAVEKLSKPLSDAQKHNTELKSKIDQVAREAEKAKTEVAKASSILDQIKADGKTDKLMVEALRSTVKNLADNNDELRFQLRETVEIVSKQARALAEATEAKDKALLQAATSDQSAAHNYTIGQNMGKQVAALNARNDELLTTVAVLHADNGRLKLSLAILVAVILLYIAARICKRSGWGQVILFWLP